MDVPLAPWQQSLASMLGIFVLIFGYRMARFATKLQSMLLFVGLAGVASQSIGNRWMLLGIAATAAILGFRLGNAYYYVNLALMGALAGVVGMVAAAGGNIGWDSGLASAVLGGMLAVRFERPIVILATSMVGAVIMLLAKIEHPVPPELRHYLLGGWVVFTLLGCFFQTLLERRSAAKRPVPGDP